MCPPKHVWLAIILSCIKLWTRDTAVSFLKARTRTRHPHQVTTASSFYRKRRMMLPRAPVKQKIKMHGRRRTCNVFQHSPSVISSCVWRNSLSSSSGRTEEELWYVRRLTGRTCIQFQLQSIGPRASGEHEDIAPCSVDGFHTRRFSSTQNESPILNWRGVRTGKWSCER